MAPAEVNPRPAPVFAFSAYSSTATPEEFLACIGVSASSAERLFTEAR